ncbi:MAG: glycoside hydrolase family 43 protein [Victivallales bacterium]|nr:glycoside hydrolase family 43 protein [Victivallales bacterium]
MNPSSIPAERRLPLADPFILFHDGLYYAYGTFHPEAGFIAFVSSDLIHWRQAAGRAAGGRILDKADSFGEEGFWAPEVYCVNGRFHIYYTASQRICAATADHPLGPFRQVAQTPLIADEYTIDNTLFIDDDGKPYMFFVRGYYGSNIWSVELEADCLRIVPETLRYHSRPWQAWETQDGLINEGPFVLKHGGLYYLTYSGNRQTSPDYGVGCAIASGFGDIWRKCDYNPILKHHDGLFSTGHHSFFYDRDGQFRVVFHARMSQDPKSQRHAYIASAHFEDILGQPSRLVISPDFIIPTVE